MKPVKDAKETDPQEAAIVPLFPLYDHVLLPGIPTPYRVFEPRYCALVRDLLAVPDNDRYLCIPRLVSVEQEPGQFPVFHPVAAIARISKCTPLPNGEFQIMVLGLERRSLVELPSNRPYRLALSQPLPDVMRRGDEQEDETLIVRNMEDLSGALISLVSVLGTEAEPLLNIAASGANITDTIYRLGSVLIHHPDRRQDFLEQRSLVQRIRQIKTIVTGLFGLAVHHTGDSTKILAN